jgi:hypothetical protein
LSWLVLVAAVLPLFLLDVPGYVASPTLLTAQPFQWGGSFAGPPPDPDDAKGPLQVSEFVHGWPLTYLRRASGTGGKGWRKWTAGSAILGSSDLIAPWDLNDAWWGPVDAAEWNVIYLIVDLALAIAIVLTATWASHVWIRRRGNRIRLRIVDLIAAMTVVGLVVGWWRWHLSLREAEATFVATGPLVDSPAWGAEPVYAYRGPEWLARLVGDYRLKWCRHLTGIRVDGAKVTAAQLAKLRRLPMIEDVYIIGHMSDECLATLESLPRLRTFGGQIFLAPWEYEENLAAGRPLSLLSPDELGRLTRLSRLESLMLHGERLTIEDMAIVDMMPNLKKCNVEGIAATAAEQHAFRDARPHLEVLCDEEDSRRPMWRTDGGHVAPEWRIAYYRVDRWRWADSHTPPEYHAHDGSFDLRSVKLTAARLAALKPFLPETDDLLVGPMPSEELSTLVATCARLETFTVKGPALDRAMLERLAASRNLKSLYVSQGAATVVDFVKLKTAPKLEWLTIYNCTLTPIECRQVAESLPDAWVEIFRGADEESERADTAPDPFDEF